MNLDALFGSSATISWTQELARAVLLFAYGLVVVRIAGRRVFGQWAALDIVVSIIIGSNLSRALTGNAPLWSTIGATTLLILLHWLMSQAAARWPAMSRLFEGAPIRVVYDGTVDDRARWRHAVSTADLGEAMRAVGVEDVGDVRYVVLEPSGNLTATPRTRETTDEAA